jgi:rhodanese-related sulfurtransferase
LAAELGYSNVYGFREGLPGWIKAGYETVTVEKLPKLEVSAITAIEMKQMMDDGVDFVMVDVRKGINDDQFWIAYKNKYVTSLDDLQNVAAEVPTDRKIVIVDLVGKRSNTAGRYLIMKGFSDVIKLSGGIEKWMKDGLPTEYAK